MAKVPVPYEHSNEIPEEVLSFSRGSNNSTRYTVRLQEYTNGDLCLQLEDQTSGGEAWMDEDDLADLVTELTDALVLVIARNRARQP